MLSTASHTRLALIGTKARSLIHFRRPLIEAFVRSGCDVLAFATDYDDEAAELIRIAGATPMRYKLDRTGTNPAQDVASAATLAYQLRRCHVNVALSCFMKPVVYGSIAARLAGVGRCFAILPGLGYTFTETNDGVAARRRVAALALRRLLRLSLPLNDKLFLYNQDDVLEIVRMRLVNPKRIARLNGTGVDLEAYRLAAPVTQPPTFLMAGRLLVEKGVREFAAAAKHVKRAHPTTRFVLLGATDSNPGSLTETELKRMATASGVEWPGHVSDVRPWLAQASVYVLPSYREGVPRSTQEAMAMGRPVITTDTAGCRDTVEEGRNGFLVPVRDPVALSGRMLRFVHNPELIARLGLESRRLAEERFNVHAINAEILTAMGLPSRRPSPAIHR